MAKLHSHSRLSKNRNYVKDVIGYPQSQTNRTNVVPVEGEKGDTPYIGGNDNWWIDGHDTGIKAEGQDGKTPYIGSNNNWWIDGVDTGHTALSIQNSPETDDDIFN